MAGRDSYRAVLQRDGRSAGSGARETQDFMSVLRSAFGERQWGPGQINPFAATAGEALPAGAFRNHAGLLICGAVQMSLSPKEEDLLGREIEFLQEHVVIASFVNGDLLSATEFAWLTELRRLAAPGQVLFQRPAGNGFSYIRTDGLDTTRRILLHALHQFPGGTAVYQQWVKSFNPLRPLGLYFPTWITLPSVPLEYVKLARQVAGTIGKVLGKDLSGSARASPRFCIGFDISHWWCLDGANP
jgi:hypothetical protein